MKAKEIINSNETAIMIFTDGRNLNINNDETGTSGVWRINKKTTVDKVVVYCRNKTLNKNEIYLGDFTRLLPSNEKDLPNRSVVQFTGMKFVGYTGSNWNEFTNTKQGSVSPIKYIR